MQTISSAVLVENGNVRVKRTRHGVMLYNVHDAYIGRSLDAYGEFSHAETKLFEQMIKPGMTVLDVGANIGAHTLCFAAAVGPTGLVIAFEPQPVVHQMLVANLALNEVGNVRTLQLGVGSEVGQASMPRIDFSRAGNFGGVSLGSQGTDTVRICSIDSLELSQCHFIKIDVEGMEGDVIEGAVETIKRHRPSLYVENDRRETSAALISRLSDLNFELYWHAPPLYSAQNIYGNQDNMFPGTVSLNLICLPRELNVRVNGLKAITDPQEWPLSA